MDNRGQYTDNLSPEISVIIPVYNVAPFIREAAESLFKQTLSNIEYIFIDDYSQDASLEILKEVIEEYPERKPFVKIIEHKENKGVSFTREEGVRLARGNWLIHCDSDDVVEPEIYSRLLDAAKRDAAQIAICSFKEFIDKKHQKLNYQGKGSISSFTLIERLSGYKLPSLHGSLCNKLIKKELWERVTFDKEIAYCEDELALYKIILSNPKFTVTIIEESLYHYRVRENSLVRRIDDKREKEIKLLIKKIEGLRDTYSQYSKGKSFNARIIKLLYFYLQFRPSVKQFSKKYKDYLKNINDNKTLNYFERLHLRLCLQGKVIFGHSVGYCNQIAKRIIKKIKH